MELIFSEIGAECKLDYGKIALAKNDKLIPFEMTVQPDTIDDKKVDRIAIKVKEWNDIGWGFDINLRDVDTAEVGPVIRMERYTTTTFGLIILD